MTEWEFLTAVCRESGCYILLDINNIFISSFNHKAVKIFGPVSTLIEWDDEIPSFPKLLKEVDRAKHADPDLGSP